MKKPKKSKTKPAIKLSNEETGLVLRKESGEALLSRIGIKHGLLGSHCDTIDSHTVEAANLAREIGIDLQAFFSRETIDHESFAKIKQGALPFDFSAAQKYVAIARAMPQPAKTLAEVSKWIQPILAANGNLELPSRTENQIAIQTPLIEKFFLQLTLLTKPFKKLEQGLPVEEWSQKQVEIGLAETAWVDGFRGRLIKRQGNLLKEP